MKTGVKKMAKIFVCEMCGEKLRAPTEEELLDKIKEHATHEHNMQATSDMIEMLKSKIREEE